MTSLRLSVLTWLVLALPAAAHDSRPVAVVITGLGDYDYRVELREPNSLPAAEAPGLTLPADCRQLQAGHYRCGESLAGRALTLDYPGANPSLSTFIRFTQADGSVFSDLAGPGTRRLQLPAVPGPSRVLPQYIALGAEHIALGPDHLLFVACLVVLAWGSRTHRVRRLLLTITGFTLAHSLTLALAILDIMALPVPLVEALIALSIVLVASEILAGDNQSWTARNPVSVASAFGLLHGLGFASVLREIGLPFNDIPLALFAFNVGVELGQLMFIAVILAAAGMITRMVQDAGLLLRNGTAYVAGGMAAFWVIDRTVSFWIT